MTERRRSMRARSHAQVRRVHRRRSHQLCRRARRDLRVSRRERRRQVDRHPHDVRAAEADVGNRGRRRRRREPRSRGSEAAHRLHVAEVLAVRGAHGRAEHPVLRRAVRPQRRSDRRAHEVCRRDGGPGRPREDARRKISPADGASGSRWAARFCTSRASSFSTSPRAASIRCRAASSGGSSKRCRASGVTILVTTHYLDEAEHCHRIAIINAGKLAAMGTSRAAEGDLRRSGRYSRFTRAGRST